MCGRYRIIASQGKTVQIRSIVAGDAGQILGTIGSNTHRDSLPFGQGPSCTRSNVSSPCALEVVMLPGID